MTHTHICVRFFDSARAGLPSHFHPLIPHSLHTSFSRETASCLVFASFVQTGIPNVDLWWDRTQVTNRLLAWPNIQDLKVCVCVCVTVGLCVCVCVTVGFFLLGCGLARARTSQEVMPFDVTCETLAKATLRKRETSSDCPSTT